MKAKSLSMHFDIGPDDGEPEHHLFAIGPDDDDPQPEESRQANLRSGPGLQRRMKEKQGDRKDRPEKVQGMCI